MLKQGYTAHWKKIFLYCTVKAFVENLYNRMILPKSQGGPVTCLCVTSKAEHDL